MNESHFKVDGNFYPITPVPKPRMTRRDKWKLRPCVARYRAFADAVRTHKVHLPTSGSHVIFMIPFPKSYSNKKRAKLFMQPHRIKPDLKNLIAALEDAVYPQGSRVDDAAIWNYSGLTKLWGIHGGFYIRI